MKNIIMNGRVNDERIISSKIKFKVKFFSPLLRVALTSLNERFEMLNDYMDGWRFVFNLKSCINGEVTVKLESDINNVQLCD